VKVSGERVSTPAGGFKPTWERHVAAYAAAADLLPDGPLLDLGCGVGHSYRVLAPRETVGVDIDAAALAGQERETLVADMRALPFDGGRFQSVLAVQSIEHVPDPERVLAEVHRVLTPDGIAVLITPNRLTFGRPDEIVDPYHHIEYDEQELRDLCERFFARVEILGLFGSDRYAAVVARERERLDALLRADALRLRRLVPRRLRQLLYDAVLRRTRARGTAAEAEIGQEDFFVAAAPLAQALDLIAVCRAPLPQ
jgi:SAM-dependent methyltransferase